MRAALLLSVVLVPAVALAAGPQWTWEAGKQTNNGAITIKSTNGSTTYSGTQNPTGAVAKTNQNAVTQPPTVIIQATSGGGNVEALPLMATTTTIPTCPSGYTSVFTATSVMYPSCNVPPILNIGGTRFGFGYLAGQYSVGFVVDGATQMTNLSGVTLGYSPWWGAPGTSGVGCGSASPWAATLCTK